MVIDLWAKNWENASNFFNSKGNAKTKSKLKDKWYRDFMAIFTMIEKELSQSKTKEKDKNDISYNLLLVN